MHWFTVIIVCVLALPVLFFIFTYVGMFLCLIKEVCEAHFIKVWVGCCVLFAIYFFCGWWFVGVALFVSVMVLLWQARKYQNQEKELEKQRHERLKELEKHRQEREKKKAAFYKLRDDHDRAFEEFQQLQFSWKVTQKRSKEDREKLLKARTEWRRLREEYLNLKKEVEPLIKRACE